MIRILIADDQDLLCEILQTALANEPDLEIVAVANNGLVAVEKTDILRPDIVLIDINMPVMDGLEATRQISHDFPETKVIILSGSENEGDREVALAAGAKSYLPKTSRAKGIIQQIREVYLEDLQDTSDAHYTETRLELDRTKKEIQNYVGQIKEKINHLERVEEKLKQSLRQLERERGENSSELLNMRNDYDTAIAKLQATAQKSKKHSTEIARIQTLVEGQLSYIHNLNHSLKIYRKYMSISTAIAAVALIVGLTGLIA